MKIVADDRIPFLKGVFEPYAEVVYLAGERITAGDVRDADALVVRTRTLCDGALLKGSRVKVIATATIGYDHIDTRWCDMNGISWSNAPGCNSASVKQYVASVISALGREYALDPGALTLGVVGAGNVGSKVADAGRAFGMKVLLNDPPRERREGAGQFVSLDTLVNESDIISLHVPLTRGGEDSTLHLFDGKRLSSLRGNQILINSSRGQVVDGKALKALLLEGGIKAAVLDVWEDEPLIDPGLAALTFIGTPHIAGYSVDGKARATSMSVRFIARKLSLPLGDWEVQDMPSGGEPLDFTLDAAGKTAREVLFEAVLHTYDVRNDSVALRRDIAGFERLRGDYPLRREPSAYTIDLRNASPELVSSLELLGFRVIFNRQSGRTSSY